MKWICCILVAILLFFFGGLKYVDYAAKKTINETEYTLNNQNIRLHAGHVDFDIFSRKLELRNFVFEGNNLSARMHIKATVSKDSVGTLLGTSQDKRIHLETFDIGDVFITGKYIPTFNIQRVKGNGLHLPFTSFDDIYSLTNAELDEVRIIYEKMPLANIKNAKISNVGENILFEFQNITSKNMFMNASLETAQYTFSRGSIEKFIAYLKNPEDLTVFNDVYTNASSKNFTMTIFDFKAEFDEMKSKFEVKNNICENMLGIHRLAITSFPKDVDLVLPKPLELQFSIRGKITDLAKAVNEQDIRVSGKNIGDLQILATTEGADEADIIVRDFKATYHDHGGAAYLVANMPGQKTPFINDFDTHRKKIIEFFEKPGDIVITLLQKGARLDALQESMFSVDVTQGATPLDEQRKALP